MSFSNDNTNWSAWQTYGTTAAWTLSTGDGTKTVYARLMDNAGNTTTGNITASIYLDTTPPAGGSVIIDSGAAYCNTTSVTLTLSATDSGSGMGEMRFSNDNTNWSSWQTYATTAAWTLSSGNGTKTVYAQFQDNAGNTTTGNITATIILDTTPPTGGSITINSGAAYCLSTGVTLTLSAPTDSSGLASMCFSNDNTTWSSWQTYATTATWTLTPATARRRFMPGSRTTPETLRPETISWLPYILTPLFPQPALAPFQTALQRAQLLSVCLTAVRPILKAGLVMCNCGICDSSSLTSAGLPTGTWVNSGLTSTTGSGTFTFTPNPDSSGCITLALLP